MLRCGLRVGRKDQERLPVEEIQFALQAVAGLFHFPFDELCWRVVLPHPLEPGAPVEVDDCDAPAGAEIFSELLKVGNPIFEVVVGVHGKHEIDAVGRQQRVVGPGENHFDVADVFSLNRLRQQIIYLLVDIHRVDFALGSDGGGKPEGKVAAARAEIGDEIAGAKRECFDDLLRLLPLVALEAFIGALLEKRAAGDEKKSQPEQADPSILCPATARIKIQRRLGLRQRHFFLRVGFCRRAIDFP